MKIMLNGAKCIINKLYENGYIAYMVGGSVRDRLMGITPLDYDITTNALPDDIIRIFDKTFLTGKKHGTVTVKWDNCTYEVTTFRIDGKYINNRKPENVEFTGSLREDLKRRDFTVNAIAFNEKEGYIDYFGGIDDIENKILRTVLNPYERFCEDALRILRGIRFSVKLGFKLEDETFVAMKELSHLISNISAERIYQELEKMFEINPYKSVLLLNEVSFFDILGLKISEDKLKALKALKSKGFINTMVALLWDNKNFAGILNLLKCSNDVKVKVKNLITGINYNFSDKVSVKKFLSKCDISESFKDLINILEISGKNTKNLSAYFGEIINGNECYKIKDLDISGNDLLNLGIRNENIGKTLDFLLLKVIEDNSKNKKETLIITSRNYNELKLKNFGEPCCVNSQ